MGGLLSGNPFFVLRSPTLITAQRFLGTQSATALWGRAFRPFWGRSRWSLYGVRCKFFWLGTPSVVKAQGIKGY